MSSREKQRHLTILYRPQSVEYTDKDLAEAQADLEKVLQYIWNKLILEKTDS